MDDIRVERREEAGATCQAILDELPTWFGIETANDAYVAASEEHPTLVAVDAAGADVGIITLVQHSTRSAEVHLLAVRPHLHRRGIGAQLLRAGQALMRRRGVRFLQVKTLGPGRPDDGYDRTRAFYEAQGFVTLEDFPDLWGPDNQARQMIKTIFPAGLVDVPDPALPWDLGDFVLRRWREDEVLVDLDNPASQRAAEKAGFVREGIRRGYEEVPGRDERSDLWCFARLASD